MKKTFKQLLTLLLCMLPTTLVALSEKSDEKPNLVDISGTLQIDQIYPISDSQKDKAATTLSTGALLRGADVSLSKHIYDWFFNIDLIFTGATVPIATAFIDYQGFENTSIMIGQVPSPFCLENSNSSKWLPFLERSMVASTFKPCIGPGVKVSHWSDTWAINFAIRQPPLGSHNSDYEKDLKSAKENKTKLPTRQKYDRWGGSLRFTAAPIHNDEMTLHLGGSYSYQRLPAKVRFSTNPEFKGREDLSILDTGDISSKGYHVVGPELGYLYGPVHFESEFLFNQVESNEHNDPSFYGWYAQTNYMIFGPDKTYDIKDGKFGSPNFSSTQTTALQSGLRFSTLDLNDKKIFGGEAKNYTLSITYYINPKIKVAANYIHSRSTKKEKSEDKNAKERNLDLFALRLQTIF